MTEFDSLQFQLRTEMRVALARRGWNQKQVAEKVGLSEKAMSQMMRGGVMGRLSTWDAMFAALGHSLVLGVKVDPEWEG